MICCLSTIVGSALLGVAKGKGSSSQLAGKKLIEIQYTLPMHFFFKRNTVDMYNQTQKENIKERLYKLEGNLQENPQINLDRFNLEFDLPIWNDYRPDESLVSIVITSEGHIFIDPQAKMNDLFIRIYAIALNLIEKISKVLSPEFNEKSLILSKVDPHNSHNKSSYNTHYKPLIPELEFCVRSPYHIVRGEGLGILQNGIAVDFTFFGEAWKMIDAQGNIIETSHQSRMKLRDR